MTASSIRTAFTSSLGHELAACLDPPPGPVRGYALFAHCFTCSKDSRAARQIAGKLAALGIGVLRFDFTGLGSSEGEFANTSFSSNVEDLIRAADHLRTHFAAPSLLIGHSLGGAAVLAAAHRVPEATAVATIAAPSGMRAPSSRRPDTPRASCRSIRPTTCCRTGATPPTPPRS